MMKPTPYETFGENTGTMQQSLPHGRAYRVSVPLDGVRQRNGHGSAASTIRTKTPVTYFVTEKEEQLAKQVRSGKRDVSSSSVFMYLGSMPHGHNRGEAAMLTGRGIRIEKILPEYLEINVESQLVFERYQENERLFDKYTGLAFVKGMTDIATKRTMIIVGDKTHHGQAAQGYFMIGERPYNFEDKIGFGNLVLWNNIGNLAENGFLGIDYQHKSSKKLGGAQSLEDAIRTLATLNEQGFSQRRPVFLLRTPHMREHPLGAYLRTQEKVLTLYDYLKLEKEKIQGNGLSDFLLSKFSEIDEAERQQFNRGGNYAD